MPDSTHKTISAIKPLLSRGELQHLFRYDVLLGRLFWISGRRKGRATGKRQVWIDGEFFLTHRIIYKLTCGEEPPLLDHKDRSNKNNRVENLRPANKTQNGANSKDRERVYALPRGVYFEKNSARNPYQAKIQRDYLGAFPTPEAASAVYRAEALRRFGEFANV